MNKELDGLEVLILTPNGRDAELTQHLLGQAGFTGRRIATIEDLADEVETAGAVILSEDTMAEEKLRILKSALVRQPVWSDIPIILFASSHGSAFDVQKRLEWIGEFLQNYTLLEKPVRLATLLTVVRAALHSRKRQFEQKEILKDLRQATLDARQASEAKSAFLANISHEIRTPLSVIVGFLDLLKMEGAQKKDFAHYVDIIARNGEQLANLINDVLDLSKIESGKMDVLNEDFNLDEFLVDLKSLIRPMVEQGGLDFDFSINGRTPTHVKGDAGKIRQILINLVGNAVKFTNSGSVKVEVECKSHEITHDLLSIMVKDTGMGIDEEKREKLFKAFSQADSSITREFGGTGLGLLLSKELAKAMGGDLRLASTQKGEGSTFCFDVLLEKSVDSVTKEAIAKLDEKALVGMTILLAEDTPDNQFLMTEYLSGAGARVEVASNGQEAFELAQKTEFDVILMDLQMPVMDGITATKKLRKSGHTGPILALTAHAMEEDKRKSLVAGFNDHFTKPILGAKLIQAVKAYR